MATKNLTRTKGRHKKRDISVFTTHVTIDEFGVSGDVYEVFKLPFNSLVTRRSAYIVTASDDSTSAAADVGIDGGAELGNMDLTALAGSNGFTAEEELAFFPTGGTVTVTPAYGTNDPTVGEAILVIEYVEIDKTTGDVTNFSAT